MDGVSDSLTRRLQHLERRYESLLKQYLILSCKEHLVDKISEPSFCDPKHFPITSCREFPSPHVGKFIEAKLSRQRLSVSHQQKKQTEDSVSEETEESTNQAQDDLKVCSLPSLASFIESFIDWLILSYVSDLVPRCRFERAWLMDL